VLESKFAGNVVEALQQLLTGVGRWPRLFARQGQRAGFTMIHIRKTSDPAVPARFIIATEFVSIDVENADVVDGMDFST
jgi:hypothetical protein